MKDVNIVCNKKIVKSGESVKMVEILNGLKYVVLVKNCQITEFITTKFMKNVNVILNI